MKFNCGEWMMKKGVTAYNAAQIREISVLDGGKTVYIYAVDYRDDVRGMGGPILEIYVSSPVKDVLRMQCFHFKGDRRKYPSFELKDEQLTIDVTEKGGKTILTSGNISLEIEKNPCSFTYFYKGEKLTSVGEYFGRRMLSYITTDDGIYMRAQLDLDIGEKVYGFGEKFTPFVKNGQVVDIWNEDGGTTSEISYKSIPFYVTNRGYGVLVNDSGPVSFEVCSESVTRVQFSVPGEKLDFMVIGGGDMKSVLSNYTALSGRPALPPAWSFGLWLSSSFTTSYDEKTILGFIDGMRERNIPLSVFHIDCYWMKENEWCGFEWDKNMFPDVSSFLQKIKDRGIKVCVWINPYIGQKAAAFDEAAEKGYLLRRSDGNIWQWDLWQAGLGIVDFTNPEAVRWYKDKLKGLMRQGVDAFKTDFGERIPVDCVYFDGSDPVRMHNYYTYLYNKIVYEAVAEYKGEKEVCLFARSATVGGQKFPVHWGGDCNSTFSSMYETLRGGLSLCLSGFGFWSHDIGGFEGTAEKGLYKRWLQFGLLSSHSRLHASQSYRVPWLFGEEAVEVCRKFSGLKNTLMPYLYSLAVESHTTGIPVMRAMVLEFDELGAEDCDRQYMLGDALLVAPVMADDGTVDFYLPYGEWTHYLSGEKVWGGGWRREKYGYDSLPLYVRENTILPVGDRSDTPVYDYTEGICLQMYSVKDAFRKIFDSEGNGVILVKAIRKEKILSIDLEGKTDSISILLIGETEPVELSGGVGQLTEKGWLIRPKGKKVEVRF